MKAIKIHPLDNVAVALEDIAKGEEITAGDRTVTASEPVARGHKIALTDIAKDEAVIKYGNRIGQATKAIAAVYAKRISV